MFTTKRNKVLADGGMMQEGGTVDEVSGNEVPVGSTKEEVRDDVDAKLSVGEYVFPADVTRYFGIAKLEAMRKEAQDSLKQMDAGGRMGNAAQVSDEASSAYDEGKFANEIDQSISEYDNEQKYAEGGVVTYDPAANQEKYKRAPLKGFEMIPMSDDKGNTIYIPFINGKPQLNVPSGYSIRAASTTPPATPTTDSTVATAPAAQEQRSGGSDNKKEMSQAQKDFFDNESPEDRDARMQKVGDVVGGAVNAFATIAVPGYAVAKKVLGVINDPYGFFAPTPLSTPENRLAVQSPKAIAEQEQRDLVDSFFNDSANQSTILNKAVEISVDKNIDPNDALDGIMKDYGVTVGPAITKSSITTTNLGSLNDSGTTNAMSGGFGDGSTSTTTSTSTDSGTTNAMSGGFGDGSTSTTTSTPTSTSTSTSTGGDD